MNTNKTNTLKRQTCMLLAVCVLSALCTLPVMGQLKNTTPANQKYQLKPVAALETDMNKIKSDFKRAVYDGDIAAVKKILGNNSLYTTVLLRTKMYSRMGRRDKNEAVYPICVATQKGYHELVKYMLAKDPSLKNVTCGEYKYDLFDLALVSKKADTAILMFDLLQWAKSNPLAVYTEYFRDRAQLQKLIPALLDRGLNPNEILVENKFWDGDAFFKAAQKKNINFLTILRDEMKKRGHQNLTAEIREYYCSGPYVTSDDVIRMVKQMENSSEAKLLKKYGIKVHAQAETTWYGCD